MNFKGLIGLICFASCSYSAAYAHTEERATIKTHLLQDEERLQLFKIQEEKEKSSPYHRSVYGAIARSYFDPYIYPTSVHQAVAIGPYGETIALEDGSTFAVASSDQYLVNYWPLGSTIYVLPNHGCFFGLFRSSYDFCLYNATTNEKIEVDLILGPYLYGDLSEWIIDVDVYNGLIWLRDGSVAEVHPNDRYLLWDWEVLEHVILGTNDGSDSGLYSCIIVNVASVTYVRIRFL